MSDSPSPDPVPPDASAVVDPFHHNQLVDFIGECFEVIIELPVHLAAGHLYNHGKLNLNLLVKMLIKLLVVLLTVLSVILAAYITLKILSALLSLHLLVTSIDIGGFLRRLVPALCRLLTTFSSSIYIEQICTEQITDIIIDEAVTLLS